MKSPPTGGTCLQPSGLRDVPWHWIDGLIGVAFLLPWRFLLLLPRDWLVPLLRQPQWVLWIVVYLIPVAWRLIFPLGMAFWRLPTFRVSVPGWRRWLREGAVAFVVLAACWGLVLAVVIPWLLISGQGSSVPSVWSGGDRLKQIDAVLLLSAMTVAPLTEEVFFRGLVYNCLRRYSPVAIAALFQAAIFALLHPFDPFHLATTFVLGVVLALIYEWRKTLLAPILLHAMQNVSATIAVALLGQA